MTDEHTPKWMRSPSVESINCSSLSRIATAVEKIAVRHGHMLKENNDLKEQLATLELSYDAANKIIKSLEDSLSRSQRERRQLRKELKQIKNQPEQKNKESQE